MFQLTRKADYAIRLMLEVASQNGERVSTAEVARSQDIPYQFLRKVAQELVGRGLLISDRGLRGGLRLARPAGSISMFEVVRAIEEPALNDCTIVPPACERRDICSAFPVWLKAQNQLEALLRGELLSHLVERQAAIGGTPLRGGARTQTKWSSENGKNGTSVTARKAGALAQDVSSKRRS